MWMRHGLGCRISGEWSGESRAPPTQFHNWMSFPEFRWLLVWIQEDKSISQLSNRIAMPRLWRFSSRIWFENWIKRERTGGEIQSFWSITPHATVARQQWGCSRSSKFHWYLRGLTAMMLPHVSSSSQLLKGQTSIQGMLRPAKAILINWFGWL